VARLLLFAGARDAAGCRSVDIAATSVGDVLDQAVERFGERFAAILAHSKVWVDGEPAERTDPVTDQSEVAVLPPVSGG
jgi:sulfur-carrier protein